LIVVHPIRR